MKKIPVAIFGCGFISLDLLSKVIRSPILECSILFCRTVTPFVIRFTKKYNIKIVEDIEEGFTLYSNEYEVLFDATSAVSHAKYSKIFHSLNKIIVNLTPEKSGELCVPIINVKDLVQKDLKYLNMVSCGGQAGIPIIYAVSRVVEDMKYVELVSSMSSKSLGSGSRINIDEYIETTQNAIKYFTNNTELDVKLLLNINNAEPPVNMTVSIFIKTDLEKINEISESVHDIVLGIQKYVPNYKLLVEPRIDNDYIMIMVEVQGVGDFLPKFAGNLDIITCAAVQSTEAYFNLNE